MTTFSLSLCLLLLCACAPTPELCRRHDPPPLRLMQKPQVESQINQILSKGQTSDGLSLPPDATPTPK